MGAHRQETGKDIHDHKFVLDKTTRYRIDSVFAAFCLSRFSSFENMNK